MISRRRVVAVKKQVEVRAVHGVEDMVLIPKLSEEGVVGNLELRLRNEAIYTNIGHVLVVCNPFKWLPIFGEDSIKRYVHQQRVDVPPHIYATAECAYRAMITEEESQCVIISGESGAGKTEASKQIQTYIAGVCGGGQEVDDVKRVFLESNPVLESMGNAKTLRNNNSSRFGKLFELKFDRFGRPLGGVVTNYLLEKSRISRPGVGERNFHVFYQLLASEHAAALRLGKPETFDYLSCSTCYSVEGVDDREEMGITLSALSNVGMSNKQIQSVLKLVACVLHLGNVRFSSVQVEGVEGSSIKQSDTSLRNFCEFAQIDAATLTQALTFRELQTMAPGGKIDTYLVPQSPTQAAARRDALSKAIYSNLFDLIVARINVALDVNNTSSNTSSDTGDDMLSISVLDIYGFEVFKSNGFEQLCINYVNEKLQQIFIELTLRAEQDEYAREGIAWTPIPFFNNKIVCDLLDSAKPSGLFRILDDTCKTMHGTKEGLEVDRKYVETCTQVHTQHKHYSANPSGFTVKHYAGDVVYSTGKLAESNKDALNKDLLMALKTTGDKLLAHLFQEPIDEDNKKQPPTASNRIRTQCAALVTALMDCAPHYVRCIKSNDAKQPLKIDPARVKHQVQYLGLVENIKVRRAGFAYRAEYHRFLERFAMLSPQTYPEWRGADKDGCRAILKHIAANDQIPGLTKEEAQLGKSKIFVRQPETYFALERLLEIRRGDFVARMQKAWRRYTARREYVKLCNLMARLYRQHGKARRRDSIFRPFIGDYLIELDASILEAVREGVFRIVDYYDESEDILFADASGGIVGSPRVASSNGSNGGGAGSTDVVQAARDWAVEKVLLVVTSKALYILTINPPPPTWKPNSTARGGGGGGGGASKSGDKVLPLVTLRRRILIAAKEKGQGSKQLCLLQSLVLSKLADECVGVKIKPSSALPQPIVQHWVPDNQQATCFATGAPFTFFSRRHHCRVCGNVFSDKACDSLQAVPDLGHYTPVRVCESCLGVESSDGCEDLVLVLARRTELASVLRSAWGKCPYRAKAGDGELPIAFQNSLKLDNSFSGGLTRRPAEDVAFTDAARTAVLLPGFSVSLAINGSKLVVAATPGLPHDVCEEKQRRQQARQKAAAERRRREERERAERAAVREEARERDRLVRLAEKKARKAQEKEEKRQAEAATAAAVADKPRSEGRKFGSGGGGGGPAGAPAMMSAGAGAGSELAARMAKMRARAGDS